MYTLEIKLSRGSIIWCSTSVQLLREISANPLVQVEMVIVSKRLYNVLIYVKITGKNYIIRYLFISYIYQVNPFL